MVELLHALTSDAPGLALRRGDYVLESPGSMMPFLACWPLERLPRRSALRLVRSSATGKVWRVVEPVSDLRSGDYVVWHRGSPLPLAAWRGVSAAQFRRIRRKLTPVSAVACGSREPQPAVPVLLRVPPPARPLRESEAQA
jgi:hypothetical protein